VDGQTFTPENICYSAPEMHEIRFGKEMIKKESHQVLFLHACHCLSLPFFSLNSVIKLNFLDGVLHMKVARLDSIEIKCSVVLYFPEVMIV